MTDTTDLPEQCPVCKSDVFLNPHIKFLVSPCYHRLCENCVARLFAHGSAPCPLCSTTLRRTAFTVPTFVDMRVEKEIRVRRMVMASLPTRERSEFVGAKEWEDYWEEVELLVSSLVDDVDGDRVRAKLDDIRRNNLTSSKRRGPMSKSQSQVQPASADAGLRIEQDLLEERKRRRVEKEADLEALASGKIRMSVSADSIFKSLQSGLKRNKPVVPVTFDPFATLSVVPCLLPINDHASVCVSERAIAGGLRGELVSRIAFHHASSLLY